MIFRSGKAAGELRPKKLLLSAKSFVGLFAIVYHNDADGFFGVIYFVNNAKIADAKFVSIDAGQFFCSEFSRVLFKFNEILNELIVRFSGKAFEFFDRGFCEVDAVGHLFIVSAFGKIVIK